MLNINKNLTFRLNRLAQEFSNQATALLKQHSEFKLAEWRLMVLIMRADARTASAIIEQTRFDRALVSRLLKGMEKSGYITLETDPNDGRKQIIEVTDYAREAFLVTEKIMTQRQKALSEYLSGSELNALFNTLDKLHEVAKLREFD